MTIQDVLAAVTAATVAVLEEGSSADKLYLRIHPDGTVNTKEAGDWTCSKAEYFKRVPHEVSLEIPRGTRNYSNLTDEEKAENAYYAPDAAAELVGSWLPAIERWIAAGNLEVVA